MLYPPPFYGSVLVLFLFLVWNFYEKAKVDTSVIHNWELPRDKVPPLSKNILSSLQCQSNFFFFFFLQKATGVCITDNKKIRSIQSEICMLKTNKQANPNSISDSGIYDPCGPWMNKLSSEGTEKHHESCCWRYVMFSLTAPSITDCCFWTPLSQRFSEVEEQRVM